MPTEAKILTVPFSYHATSYFLTFLTMPCTSRYYISDTECCQTDLSSMDRLDTPHCFFFFFYPHLKTCLLILEI